MSERHPDDDTIALFAARYAMGCCPSKASACIQALSTLVHTISESTRHQIAREAREDLMTGGGWPVDRMEWYTLTYRLNRPLEQQPPYFHPPTTKEAEGVLLLNALRYALPRMSTASSIVSGRLIERWEALSSPTRQAVVCAITEALQTSRAGESCDRALWHRVLAHGRPVADRTAESDLSP